MNFETDKIYKEPTIALQRNLLASIDLSDTEDELSETDRRAYCAAIFAVFPRLEKDIKKLLNEQLLFSANQADTWEKVIFGRGTFNGMALLLEKWKEASAEHIANSKTEEFDKTNSLPEI